MSRKNERKSDPAFCESVEGVRTAVSVLPGLETKDREAELITTFALTRFARAGGLADPSVSRLANFAPDLRTGDDVQTRDRKGVRAAPGKPDREGSRTRTPPC